MGTEESTSIVAEIEQDVAPIESSKKEESLLEDTADVNLDIQYDDADLNLDLQYDQEPLTTTEEPKVSSISQSLSEAVSVVTSTISSLFVDYTETENSSSDLDQPSVVISNIDESLDNVDDGEDKIDNDLINDLEDQDIVESKPLLGSSKPIQNIESTQQEEESITVTTESPEIEYDDVSSYDSEYDDDASGEAS